MILPNQLWAGRADYPSKLLPHSETFRKYGDQVAQCVAAAHRHGLQVHVWKVNFNLGNAPREFVEKLRREGSRTQVSANGKATDWLCPSHPGESASSKWTRCWKWRGCMRSTACTSTISAIPTPSTATATAAESGSRQTAASR